MRRNVTREEPLLKRLAVWIAGFLAGEVAGAFARAAFPPVPLWAFALSVFVSLAGIVAIIFWTARPPQLAGDFIAALFAGTYMGYIW